MKRIAPEQPSEGAVTFYAGGKIPVESLLTMPPDAAKAIIEGIGKVLEAANAGRSAQDAETKGGDRE